MSIFAISDLHLSFNSNKPMDRFGPAWVNHADKIARAWRESVRAEDTVLICGDTSWAMRLDEARADLDYVAALPGRKVLLRGNHDYWWGSMRKLRAALDPSIVPLHNDSLEVEGWTICGARGWLLPGPETLPEDEKIYQRELGRLRLSLQSAASSLPRLAMLHYPPYAVESGRSAVLDLLHEFEVQVCTYGHLHALPPDAYPNGTHAGIEFHCVSVDLIDFAPRRVVD